MGALARSFAARLTAAERAIEGIIEWQDAIASPRKKRDTNRLDNRLIFHGLLHDHFDAEELKTLCFDLGVVYDDLGGDGHDDRVRELILRCMRDECMGRLLWRVRQLRPAVDWPEIT